MSNSSVKLVLPKLHYGQYKILQSEASIRVVMCGRQWGKSYLCKMLALETMFKGMHVGYLVPSFALADKMLDETLEFIPKALHGRINKANRKIILKTGGSLQFWSGEAPERIRGNTYHRFIIDEAAFIPDLKKIWDSYAAGTMARTNGDAIFVSTPNGLDYFNSLFLRGKYQEAGYESFHFPSSTSPFVSQEYLEATRKRVSEDVFKQEYLAEPMATTGNPFGIENIQKNIIEELSAYPTICFAVDIAKYHDYTVIIGLDQYGHMTYFDRYRGEWSLTKEKIRDLPANTMKVVDSTGVGDVIFEELLVTVKNIHGFKFTVQSKPQLMKELIIDVQAGNIKYNDTTAEEMMSLDYFLTSTGHPKYQAKSGYHDDCVMSLAMCNRYMKQATYSNAWQLYLV